MVHFFILNIPLFILSLPSNHSTQAQQGIKGKREARETKVPPGTGAPRGPRETLAQAPRRAPAPRPGAEEIR